MSANLKTDLQHWLEQCKNRQTFTFKEESEDSDAEMLLTTEALKAATKRHGKQF